MSLLSESSDLSRPVRTAADAAGLSEASVGDFIVLMKPRVMSLVIFTALVGMLIAPGSLHPVIGFTALLCIAIGAGAAGALNMWYDAEIDALMLRTARRPIPMGRVAPGEALGFGVTLAAGSVLILGLLVNWLAASLLAFTIFFYAVVYTMWLKRWTPQNIVIGGAAGAFPPMIGWAASTGGVGIESVLLFLIIFFWTPPHFWALSLYRADEYARAGIPMLPVVAGPRATRRQIFVYSLILLPVGMSPWILSYAGAVYGGVSALGGALFVGLAARVLKAGDSTAGEPAARHLFAFSILYLFVLFATLLIEQGFGHSFGGLLGRLPL